MIHSTNWHPMQESNLLPTAYVLPVQPLYFRLYSALHLREHFGVVLGFMFRFSRWKSFPQLGHTSFTIVLPVVFSFAVFSLCFSKLSTCRLSKASLQQSLSLWSTSYPSGNIEPLLMQTKYFAYDMVVLSPLELNKSTLLLLSVLDCRKYPDFHNDLNGSSSSIFILYLLNELADSGGIEPLSSFPLFYATGLEDLCGYTAQ